MNNVFINLLMVQFKEFYRSPSVLFWGFAFPILMIVVLGLAFMHRPAEKRTIAVVGDKAQYDATFQQQLDSLEKTGSFKIIFLSEKDALLRTKRGQLSVYIKPSVENEMYFHFDPDNSDARMTYLLATHALMSSDKDKFKTSYITTSGHRYIDFLVPGLLAMGIMNSCLWGIGWNLIDFRIKKLMRRMIATPMNKAVFLLSQVVSRALLLIFEMSIIYLFAHWAFGVEIQGNLPTLLLAIISGVVTFSALAVLLASRAEHSQVGNGLINATTMPMLILSGIFFSYENFPDWAVGIVKFLPLTLVADAMRAVFNEGASLIHVWQEIAILLGLGVVFFTFALKIFKWR